MNGVSEFNTFLATHKVQLESSAVPELYWFSLYAKLSKQVFDAGEQFSLLQVENDEEEAEWRVETTADVTENDPNQIFLIDHAWTFKTDQARQMLLHVPGLATRMARLMDIKVEEANDVPNDCLVELLMSAKWSYSQTYSVGNASSVEERQPVWYVMDEFGSRVQHSDTPSHRVVPLLWAGDGLGYSIMFPINPNAIQANTSVTRDYVEGQSSTDPLSRKALMCAWTRTNLTHVDTEQKEPDLQFWQSNRQAESLPDPEAIIPLLPLDRIIKVYSEYSFINQNLTHDRFTLTDNMAEADILWLSTHFKEFLEFSKETPEKRINQFPGENVITIKDMLCVVARRMDKKYLPVTFNLVTELPNFVSYYQKLEESGEDTHFIVKPWNLARGLDMQVCRDLKHIMRLPASGPKIAQKYLHNPVLFHREELGMVKFDIRYIILLSSIKPLKVFAYNRFWLRFANVPFSLDKLDMYEKHFTVMNYTDTNLKQMFCHDFIQQFEYQNPGYTWLEIESEIFTMLRGVFDGATALPPPAGMGHSAQSGAMYATDLMLNWEMDSQGKKIIVPKVLEFNWLPDCERACDYYPDFFNNIFSALWLGETEGHNVTQL